MPRAAAVLRRCRARPAARPGAARGRDRGSPRWDVDDGIGAETTPATAAWSARPRIRRPPSAPTAPTAPAPPRPGAERQQAPGQQGQLADVEGPRVRAEPLDEQWIGTAGAPPGRAAPRCFANRNGTSSRALAERRDPTVRPCRRASRSPRKRFSSTAGAAGSGWRPRAARRSRPARLPSGRPRAARRRAAAWPGSTAAARRSRRGSSVPPWPRAGARAWPARRRRRRPCGSRTAPPRPAPRGARRS